MFINPPIKLQNTSILQKQQSQTHLINTVITTKSTKLNIQTYYVQINNHQNMLLPYLIAFSLLSMNAHALTGQTVASYCHCDLTSNFCDIGCCCDPSCTSSVTSECYNSKSNSYCPQPTFFARIGTSYLNSAGCFYYNSTNKIVEEVSLTTSSIADIADKQKSFTRLAATSAAVKSGYQIGDIMNLNGQSSFIFLTASGDCLTPTMNTAGATSFQLKFGLNMNLFCKNTSTATLPFLYSSFSGKKINQFSSDNVSTVTIPSFDDPTITSVSLQIVVGYYGSNKSKYIEKVVSTTSTVLSSQRSLSIVFVQPNQISVTSFSPTFFPQIPSDMFYPIYLMS